MRKGKLMRGKRNLEGSWEGGGCVDTGERVGRTSLKCYLWEDDSFDTQDRTDMHRIIFCHWCVALFY